ncbi:protein kinase domain-containing protein [Neorhodopirellula lusitana]|uniref:protein kinase domain-containing protein n=1 Tax=Neorhodopirellula lusitana TaxID=445327 RepID=UPI00385130E2
MISFVDLAGAGSGDSVHRDLSDEPIAMRHLTDAQKDQLGELLEKYMSALEVGLPPSVESLTQACPELREALQGCVAGLESLHRLAGGEAVAPQASDDTNTLGDFELSEVIGRGGMGVVYRATQVSLRRTVAIKLLPLSSVLDANRLTRFHQEAEAAASLQHPNIVPVFAIGCERGVHFYAMQFIDGDSMDECDSLPLDWRVAVQQATEVADGLHAAHELGIIHRDIKPSNLIVDQDGKAWITDFGLARIQGDLSLTQSGDLIGTMRYMSPEQARGESAIVDGRTDIYSLGATLYEMLAGHPAHDGEDAPAILRQIDQDAVPPLTRFRNDLPRDLATVISKAMSSRRDERYDTAREFANDLRRVLAGEPTIARPPNLVDLWTRFAVKHQKGLAAATLVGVLALVGFAISNARLAAQKSVSDTNADWAQRNYAIGRKAIDEMGTQVAELLEDNPAASPVRHFVLSRTLEYYERLVRQPGTLDREHQLDLAITHGKIGSFRGELGLNQEALASLEVSQQIYAKLAQQYPSDSDLQLQWSISQNNLAEKLAGVGEFETAAKWFGKAIANQQRLPSGQRVNIEFATTLNNLGQMLTESENIAEAEEVFGRAIAVLDQQATATEKQVSLTAASNQPQSRTAAEENSLKLLSTIQSNLAGLLARRDPQQASRIARKSLTLQLQRLEANPGDVDAATQVVLTLNTLAMAQAAESLHREAIETLGQAIDVSNQLRARWPDQQSSRRDLGISLNQLGLSLAAIGRMDEADKAFARSAEQARQLVKAFPEDAEVHSMLGSVLNNAGYLDRRLGNFSQATSHYTEAIEHQRLATQISPQVPRYQSFLQKHQHNLDQLRGES